MRLSGSQTSRCGVRGDEIQVDAERQSKAPIMAKKEQSRKRQ